MVRVKESRKVQPLFKVGDIVTDRYNDYGLGIKAGVNKFIITNVSDYDPMNGYIYTIEPADDATKTWWTTTEMSEFEDAEISGFEGSDIDCQMMLSESVSVSESKMEDTMKFMSMQLSGIEDQGLANVLRKIVFMSGVNWSYVNKLVKTYMPESNI